MREYSGAWRVRACGWRRSHESCDKKETSLTQTSSSPSPPPPPSPAVALPASARLDDELRTRAAREARRVVEQPAHAQWVEPLVASLPCERVERRAEERRVARVGEEATERKRIDGLEYIDEGSRPSTPCPRRCCQGPRIGESTAAAAEQTVARGRPTL